MATVLIGELIVFAVVLATVSALVWGGADYCGGRAARRVPALPVTVISQLYGLPVLAICVIFLPGTPEPADLAWGAAAGACGFFGIVLLYRSLAGGAMAVAAPITAVTGALVPMIAGLVSGERPSPMALGGAICAVLAIGLVSLGHRSEHGRASASVVIMALGAGALFGVFFVLLAQAGPASGMWSLAAVRGVSVPLGLALLARRARRSGLSLPGPLHGWIAVAGAGDIASNALYLLASRAGLLSVVAPIAALYPVSTVLLALVLDKERVRPIQFAGLGLAATALVLTAV